MSYLMNREYIVKRYYALKSRYSAYGEVNSFVDVTMNESAAGTITTKNLVKRFNWFIANMKKLSPGLAADNCLKPIR